MARSEYSEDMAVKIDREVRQIVMHCYEEARHIIRDHRILMDKLVEILLEQETIEGDDFRVIVKRFTDRPIKEPAFQVTAAG
jgi:cell division protease FtsH